MTGYGQFLEAATARYLENELKGHGRGDNRPTAVPGPWMRALYHQHHRPRADEALDMG